LRCGPSFNVHITGGGDNFYTTLNGGGRPIQHSLLQAQVAAELEIVKSVRVMLPSYKEIVERLEARHNRKTGLMVTVCGPSEFL
jgi:hypothetical protein